MIRLRKREGAERKLRQKYHAPPPHGAREGLEQKLMGRFDQCTIRRCDAVDQHWLPPRQCCEIGQLDIEIAVAMADFAQHRIRGAMRGVLVDTRSIRRDRIKRQIAMQMQIDRRQLV